MDDIDRQIIDRLQEGFPISRRPFAEVGTRLGLTETETIERLRRLRESGVLSRFGPMFNVEGFGGYVSLAAMAVPQEAFERVAELVNAYPQVAHNYARDHALNMWFVVATESRLETQDVLAEIEARTCLTVYDMPKLAEFHVHLRLKA